MGQISGSGSGIRIRDEQPGPDFLELRNHFFGLKYFNSLMRIRDPGEKNSDPGSGMENSRIRDKHTGSATLKKSTVWKRLDFPQGLATIFFPGILDFFLLFAKTLNKKSSSSYFFPSIF
jgi:hypothetical protein